MPSPAHTHLHPAAVPRADANQRIATPSRASSSPCSEAGHGLDGVEYVAGDGEFARLDADLIRVIEDVVDVLTIAVCCA